MLERIRKNAGRLVFAVGVSAATLTLGSVSALAAQVDVDDPGDDLHTSGCAVTGLSPCTLRDAITWANALPGTDTIVVRLMGTSASRVTPVRPKSALPAITDSVELWGDTTPGRSSTLIWLKLTEVALATQTD